MIFYFSGTGNSYQAALAMCAGGEQPLDMAKCLREGSFRFEPGADEAVGFVFPVYYGGLPIVVADFLKKFLLLHPAAYCFGLLTCAGGSYGAPELLARALHARGVRLDAAFTVLMPENYVLLFKTPEPPEQSRILAAASDALDAVRARVDRREKAGVHVTVRDRLVTAGMYPSYLHGRRTAKFYSDEKCVGCGVCAGRCPVGAIEMVNGRPKWVKERCVHCMACLRCNAVQYGKQTVGRLRYVNPVYKKPSQHAHH